MKPIEFKEQTLVIAKDRPEYRPLPAWKGKDGTIICCWQLTWYERLKIFITGKMWHVVRTFNQPLQPQLLEVDNPFKEAPWNQMTNC